MAGRYEPALAVDPLGQYISAIAEYRLVLSREMPDGPFQGDAVQAAASPQMSARQLTDQAQRTVVHAGATSQQATIHRREVDVAQRHFTPVRTTHRRYHVMREVGWIAAETAAEQGASKASPILALRDPHDAGHGL